MSLLNIVDMSEYESQAGDSWLVFTNIPLFTLCTQRTDTVTRPGTEALSVNLNAELQSIDGELFRQQKW